MFLRFKTSIIPIQKNAKNLIKNCMRSYRHRFFIISNNSHNLISSSSLHQNNIQARWVSTEIISSNNSINNNNRAPNNTFDTMLTNDFVDLGLEENENISKILIGNSINYLQDKEEPLGVTREAEIPEGQEYSRLHIPLKEPRNGKPQYRSNSRRVFSNENEEETALSTIDENNNNNNNNNETQESNTTDDNNDDITNSSLPYDDELFAEMLLQMEVEGAIDETWQDSKKAHLEDVMELVEVLKSLKVRDICAINVSDKTSNFDFMIFGTCEGPRHIHLAAWAAQEADALKRITKIKRRQTDHTWEVVPVGRIILNLVQESLRDTLGLERKWAVTKEMDPLAAANAPVSEGRQVKAHGLWTLTLNLQDLEDFEVDYCKDVLMRQL